MREWKQEFYVLPGPEANESIARYLAEQSDVETRCGLVKIPGYKEAQPAFIIDSVLMEKLQSFAFLRGKYRAYYRRQRHGRIYPYRSPEQITRAAHRRAKALLKKTKLATSPAK